MNTRLVVIFASVIGCATTTRGREPTAPQRASVTAAQNERPGEERLDEVRALVTEVLTPQLCPRLVGSFLGLPADGGPSSGPSAGTHPSAGRWWIRSCQAEVTDTRIALTLTGMGWTWVDRETQGFRVRQYLLFEADATLGADVSVGYDPQRRVASLWMRPVDGVRAHITPRGVVSPSATGFFSTLLGAAAAVTGASVEQRAREQAEQIGSTQLRERLNAGFTMTYALGSRQMDFMVGALERGEVPERPFPSDTARAWVVNQRSVLWPGGLDVIGPVQTADAPLGMDIELEEGEGAIVRGVCSDPLTRYFDQRFRDPAATPAAPEGQHIVTLSPGAGVQHVTLPTQACPTLLTVARRGSSDLPIRLRYRIAPASRHDAVTPTTPARVRIQVLGVSVSAQNPAGHDWDVLGGEADVSVITASITSRRQLDRAPVSENHNSTTWNRWLPGAFETARDLPLRFTVVDEDPTGDEVIGTVDLERADLPTGAQEVNLPVRSNGTLPSQTGTLRLRIEPLGE